MLDDFLGRAALAGLAVALACAPLGSFVVWRRMAFFGDATAHAALLGVALGLALAMPIFLGVTVVALAMALLVQRLADQRFGVDLALGVLSHSALAFGLIAFSLTTGPRIDPELYLFGDILAVSRADLGLIWGGAAAVVALLAWRWQALLTVTLHPDLAKAAGLSPRREELVLTLCLALVVAVAIQVVGALLITSMLLIPAAAARALVSGPEAMVLWAALLGAASVGLGLGASVYADFPTGPAIVTSAALIFVLSRIIGQLRPG